MRHPAFVLAAASVLLLLPTLVLGTLISHSSPQNLTWASQFAEQFRAGILYPRWMPESFDGLGSPAFYFYPPLAVLDRRPGEHRHGQLRCRCRIAWP